MSSSRASELTFLNRLVWDKHLHGGNIRKNQDPDLHPPGPCPLCSEPDSLRHWTLECQHATIQHARTQQLAELAPATGPNRRCVRKHILQACLHLLTNHEYGHYLAIGQWPRPLQLALLTAIQAFLGDEIANLFLPSDYLTFRATIIKATRGILALGQALWLLQNLNFALHNGT
jgi:hypothetical protein